MKFKTPPKLMTHEELVTKIVNEEQQLYFERGIDRTVGDIEDRRHQLAQEDFETLVRMYCVPEENIVLKEKTSMDHLIEKNPLNVSSLEKTIGYLKENGIETVDQFEARLDKLPSISFRNLTMDVLSDSEYFIDAWMGDGCEDKETMDIENRAILNAVMNTDYFASLRLVAALRDRLNSYAINIIRKQLKE